MFKKFLKNFRRKIQSLIERSYMGFFTQYGLFGTAKFKYLTRIDI